MTEDLAAWLSSKLGTDVAILRLDRVDFGHSAETMLLTLDTSGGRQDVVIRIRPQPPGLLEPYALERQFAILRALEPTPVRSPRVYWYEPTGEILGRDFYVMERLAGSVYERGVPNEIRHDKALVRRMCEGMVDQISAIHQVDLTRGLEGLGDGCDYLDRELEHWSREVQRATGGGTPMFDRLVAALRDQRPGEVTPSTLVHGDTKPGNFAFVDGEVTGVFDWELSTVGDPMADIGWAEVCWRFPGYVTSVKSAPSADELVTRWECSTGLQAHDRPWYRALQSLKMAAILLVGRHLYDSGHSSDPRLGEMAAAADPIARGALRDLGSDG